MSSSSLIWLSLRLQFSYILQILPASLYCRTPIRIPPVDCRDSQLQLLPTRETEGSKAKMMAGMGQTGKWRNVEGKVGFLLADAASKLVLAYLVGLHLQKTAFCMYKQGWKRQTNGSVTTEQKLLVSSSTWCDVRHDPAHLTCSSHAKGFPSQLAQRSRMSCWVWQRTSILRSRNGERSWLL